jgi:endonuclease III
MAANTQKKDRIGPSDLGIDLSRGTDSPAFKWLVACELFGRRISQDIAARAFGELDHAGLLTPRKLADADWQHLVDLLGAGGYKRYDESTARELIKLGQDVLDKYDGKVSRMADGVDTKKAIKDRVQEFKGIGPTAAQIFVREVSDPWNL